MLQEKTLPREARTSQLESRPRLPQSEEGPHRSEDPAQPKLNTITCLNRPSGPAYFVIVKPLGQGGGAPYRAFKSLKLCADNSLVKRYFRKAAWER